MDLYETSIWNQKYKKKSVQQCMDQIIHQWVGFRKNRSNPERQQQSKYQLYKKSWESKLHKTQRHIVLLDRRADKWQRVNSWVGIEYKDSGWWYDKNFACRLIQKI